MKNQKLPNLDIKFNLKKWKTKKMILKYKLNETDGFLFYTDVDNLPYILNNGINPVNKIKLENNERYTVWSYSQLTDQVNIEDSSKSHDNFWIWLSEQNINASKVAVININLNLLFNQSKKNWKYNSYNNIISIFENINIKTFEWIMVRNKQAKISTEKIINDKSLKIKIFYGLDGNVRV